MTAVKVKINAVSNPHVRYARRLHRRRVREKEGRCLLEGVRLVADAAGAGASFVLGFWEAALLGVPGGEDLLRRLRDRPPLGGLFEVHPQVMAELADTETPQGIVVVAQRPAPDPRGLLEGPALGGVPGTEPGSSARSPAGRKRGAGQSRGATIAVLDKVRDPGNVGTVIRSADASGAAGVIFMPGTADPFGPKALRASMGSAFHVPVVAAEQAVLAYRAVLGVTPPDRTPTVAAAAPTGASQTAFADEPDEATDAAYGPDGAAGPASRTELATYLPGLLSHLGYRILVADATADQPHWRASVDGRTALVLGSEAQGPDPALWAGAERISIPMRGPAESLNVAMAATVLLYEAARQREGWGS